MDEILLNEIFFKELVNVYTGFFQLIDENLNITYTSNGVTKMLGFEPEELRNANFTEFVNGEDLQKVNEWLEIILSGDEDTSTVECRIKCKKGDFTWIEINAKKMFDNGELNSIVMDCKNIQSKKMADQALMQVEQRLSLLLNNTEESFIVLNARLRIITYNKAAQERAPYFLKAPLQSGLSFLNLVDEKEEDEYVNIFEQVFQGKQVEKETYYIDETRSTHIYNHKYNPSLNQENDIAGVIITSTEITERKKLSEEIILQSERLKTAQKIARLGYFEYDFFTGDIFCSPQFRKILDLDKEVNSLQDLYRTEEKLSASEREMVRNEIEKSIYTEKDFNLEFCLKLSEGTEKVILAMGGTGKNAAGKKAKFTVTILDITESKMAVLAIQTLENKFTSLFDNSMDGIILSKEGGEIISANPSVCKLSGFDAEELRNTRCNDLFDIDDSSYYQLTNQRKEAGAFGGEFFVKHKTGFLIPVELTSVSMKDGNGELYASTVIRDITEKKKIEAEQSALTGELIKNNRDLQQFSYITSHNLRAPVANLISLLSLYNHDNVADEFNKVLIEKFGEVTRQLSQTLNDLFDVLVIKSNSNNVDNEIVSFSNIYNEVYKNIDNLLKQQNGTIEVNFSEVDQITGNRVHLESIFLNMISNAIRYSSPDRRLKINIRSYKLDNWAVVDFADNGIGIDLKRYGDRLFGLYQRFHGNKEGKGLGLYMTRSQVVAMGGKIEVESEPEKGTTFKIYFKMAKL